MDEKEKVGVVEEQVANVTLLITSGHFKDRSAAGSIKTISRIDNVNKEELIR